MQAAAPSKARTRVGRRPVLANAVKTKTYVGKRGTKVTYVSYLGTTYLGTFRDWVDAAKAYNAAAKEKLGDEAELIVDARLV